MEVAEILRQVGSVSDRSNRRAGNMQILHRIKVDLTSVEFQNEFLGLRTGHRLYIIG